MNPSNSCNTVLILGIWNSFLTNRLFSSLKSVRNLTVLFFFGYINEGAAHSDDGCHSSTPISMSLLISFKIVSLWTFGIGKALPWYGFAPSFNWKEIGSVSQSPKVSSNRSSNSVCTYSSLACSLGLKFVHLVLINSGRSTYSYFASNIFTIRWVANSVLSGSSFAKQFLVAWSFFIRGWQIFDVSQRQFDFIYGYYLFFEVQE